MKKIIDKEVLELVLDRIALDLKCAGLTETICDISIKDIKNLKLNENLIMFDTFERLLKEQVKSVDVPTCTLTIERHGFPVNVNKMSAKTLFSIIKERYDNNINRLYQFEYEYSGDVLKLAIKNCDDRIFTKQDVLPVLSEYLGISKDKLENRNEVIDKIENSIEPFDIWNR